MKKDPITNRTATNKQQAKFFVEQAKALLKTEQSPARRRRIALWGAEMNKLYLAFDKLQAPCRCKKCGIEKAPDQFGIVKSIVHYKTKAGKKRCYVNIARRKICNSCTWPTKKVDGIAVNVPKIIDRNPVY